MRFCTLIAFEVVLLFARSASAAPGCVVFSSQAQGLNGKLVSLEVGTGHGLNANFIPTGESIQKVWIDDQSQVGVSFDGELCQWTSEKQADCADAGASVIHLRQSKPINFPDLPRSPSGATLLSAITQGESGRKLYQFSVIPVKGVPTCSSITIVPDPKRLEPRTPTSVSPTQPQQTTPATTALGANSNNSSFTLVNPPNSSPGTNQAAVATPPNPSNSTPLQPQQTFVKPAAPTTTPVINNADAASRGLEVATRNGQIKTGTAQWQKAQSAITWLRQGLNPDAAAVRANCPISILTELINWGSKQP